MRCYAVIDTNVLVSSLLAKHSDSATLKVLDAVASGDIVPLYNQKILDEYDEVLHRKKFSFSEKRIRQILTMIRTFGIAVNARPRKESFVDADDLVFYEVVMEKRDDDAYLVTGNTKHFPKRYFIVTPAEMIALIESNRK